MNLLKRLWSSAAVYHATLNGSVREYVFVGILFFVITLVLTNFVLLNISSQLFVDNAGDATAGFLWLNFADPGLNPFLSKTDLVNYPVGEQLGGATFITYSALWIPLRTLSFVFGPVAGLNLMMLIGFLSASLSGYWLLKRLTGSSLIALFTAYSVAFVPYNMYKSSAHLAYIFCVVFVFILASFLAAWLKPTKKRAVIFGLSIALAFYTDGYYLLLATVMVFGLIGAAIVYGILQKFSRKDYLKRFHILCISLATLIVAILPIFFIQATQGNKIKETLSSARTDINQELHTYRSNIVDFIAPAPTNPLYKELDGASELSEYRILRSNPSESTNYVGYVNIILCAIGFVMLFVFLFFRKRSSLNNIGAQTRSAYILTGIAALVLIPLFLSFMFSPEIIIFGQTIPLPGRLMVEYDISLWRVMSRFFVPLHILISVFAGFTLWIIIQSHKLTKIRSNIVIAILTLLLALEYLTGIYRPSFDFRSSIPEAYHWLSKQKNINAVAELPIVDPLNYQNTKYITAQIVHGKKLVNLRDPNKTRLTNTTGSFENPETIDLAFQRGAQAIIMHQTSCSQAFSWGMLLHESKDAGNSKLKVCIYSLDKPISQDKVFVNFGQGFEYIVNPQDPDQNTASLIERTSRLQITDSTFLLGVSGNVRITANLIDLHNDKVNGRWEIVQNNEIKATGNIENSKASIDVAVDGSKTFELRVAPSEGSLLRPRDLGIQNTIVSSI